MASDNRVGEPIAMLALRNGRVCGGGKIVYGKFGWEILPKQILSVSTSSVGSGISDCLFDTTMTFNSYADNGKPQDINYMGMPIAYLWAYNGTYPIMELKNSTFEELKSKYGNANIDGMLREDSTFVRDMLVGAADRITGSSATVCLYRPLVGPVEITGGDYATSLFDYDRAGRLVSLYKSSYPSISSMSERVKTCRYARNMVASTSFPTWETKSGVESIQYYDEWGRPSVGAMQGKVQDGSYSYSLQTYDNLSRPIRSYVTAPYRGSTGGNIGQQEFAALSESALGGDTYGYSEMEYDALGRQTRITPPGRVWHEQKKATLVRYLTNADGEVKRYIIAGGKPVEEGCYKQGTLDCTETVNPDGVAVKVYRDIFNNTVLERRANNYDTYYVYDDMNHLRFVLPPKFQDTKDLDGLAYQYVYDGRGRVVRKKLPGCEPVRYWYDNANRLVKMQDGEMAKTGRYRTWTYDGLGRILMQCLITADGSLTSEITNYYDDYSVINGIQQNVSGISVPSNTLMSKGRLTGRVLRTGNGGNIVEVFGYDDFGYLVQKSMVYCLYSSVPNVVSETEYENNLAGQIKEERQRLYKIFSGGERKAILSSTTRNNYDYPHTGLPSSSFISVTDAARNTRADTICGLAYDDFGNVSTIDRGGTAADMTYRYDKVHGWLTEISAGNGFCQNLYRETEGNIPRFDGGISAMTWKTGNDYLRRFDYAFDCMDRLQRADFSYYEIQGGDARNPVVSLIPYVGMNNEDYTCEYYYDRNGNMLSAYRQGLVFDPENERSYDTLDDYYAEYNGNQLKSVSGTGVGNPSYYGSLSFIDGAEKDMEYKYNANGSMTKDLNKGITSIEYDASGNLGRINFDSGSSISYNYSTLGDRLSEIHTLKSRVLAMSDTMLYCGNLSLKGGMPYMLRFPGGYYSFKKGNLDGLHYYIQDYQGSNRMVVNVNGKSEQTTHYYPFGGIIGGIDRNPGLQKYKFLGKQLDRIYGLDWYDIGARQYDPVLCSWNAIDPLCEKNYYVSPYSYCKDNPIRLIDNNGLFDTDSTAIEYAKDHKVPLCNVHYANDRNEWFVAFGEDGKGYISGFIMERRFRNMFTESTPWKGVSSINSDLGTGIGFAEQKLAKPLERSNAYAFRDMTGHYINSTKPSFRFRNLDIDFSLRGANKIALGLKRLGNVSAAIAGFMTVAEMIQGQKNIIGEGGLDLIMIGVGVIPGYGWAASSIYFIGKDILEYKDLDFWNK